MAGDGLLEFIQGTERWWKERHWGMPFGYNRRRFLWNKSVVRRRLVKEIKLAVSQIYVGGQEAVSRRRPSLKIISDGRQHDGVNLNSA